MAEVIKSDTLAILVSYGQRFTDCATWTSLQQAAGGAIDWFIVDNNPEAINPPSSTIYRHYPHNPGVSQAYLDGATYAKERGYQWILLLDQDTQFPPESWHKYQEAVQRWPDFVLFSPQLWSGKLGISPAPARFGRPFASHELPIGPYALADFKPINAGMLIRLSAYLAIGGHEPSVYLDFSDFAFIRKLERHFPRAVAVPVAIQHGLSGTEIKTAEQDFIRFRHYCRCMHAYVACGGPWFWLYFWTIIRAFKLSIRHRSIHFFGLILRDKPKP